MKSLNFTWKWNGSSAPPKGYTYTVAPFQSMEATNIVDLLPDYNGPIVKIVLEYMSTDLVGKGNNGWYVRRFRADGSEYNERSGRSISAGHAMRKADAFKLANASVRCDIEGNW
jgi:hypothetical protein